MPKKKNKKVVIILINIISISLLVGGGFGLKTVLDNKKDYDRSSIMIDDLANLYNISRDNTEMQDPTENNNEDTTVRYETYSNKSFDELLKINSDTVGWLKVNNTKIDLPVVKASTNNYYLTKNFRKEYSYVGWVFADYRNKFDPLSKNTIIYGHSMRNTDGIMFGTLKNVVTQEWLSNPDNYTITFNTIYKNMKWQVFSIYSLPVTDDYLRVNFNDDTDYTNFIKMIKDRSIKDFNVEVSATDNILTLSTCYINSENRLVVHAKLIQ